MVAEVASEATAERRAGSSLARATMLLKFAPVTELVYVLVLETKF